ncbi:hypothetical protein D3C76_994340 [compost metagenome]
MTRNETGIELGIGKRRVGDDAAQKGNIGFQPADGEFVEHAQQAQASLLAVFAPGDQLAQHGVVER